MTNHMALINFIYRENAFEYSPEKLSGFFVEDFDYYQRQGDAFSCFRVSFKKICFDSKGGFFIKDPLAISSRRVDALVVKQISELTIDYSDLKTTIKKIEDIVDKYEAERFCTKPSIVILSLSDGFENFMYATSNGKMEGGELDPSILKVADIFSVTRTFSNGNTQWLNDFIVVHKTTGEKKYLQVDHKAIQTLLELDTHSGHLHDWHKNIHAIVKEANIRIFKSTGAEKVSTPSSTPPKLPKKEPLNK